MHDVKFMLELPIKEGITKPIIEIFKGREDFDVFDISNKLSAKQISVTVIEGSWLDKSASYKGIRERLKKRLQFMFREHKRELMKTTIKIGDYGEEKPLFDQEKMILG